jgi:peptidoglycan/LPS O-acetylase OafA/YrhL
MTPPAVSTPLHRNNFDLVRLFAALQVVVVHVFSVLPGMPAREGVLHAFSLFPGVPIFFFISGFLIGGSWQRNPHLAGYVSSRALRIFPALWVAVMFSLLMLMLFYREPMLDNLPTVAAWLPMQLSFLQSWNPPFLRGYGFGVVNPVLWTIPVELGFYVATPMLFAIGWKLRRLHSVLWGAAAVSFVVFIATHAFAADTLRKVFTVSPVSMLTWLWMFLLGALANLEFARIRPWIENRFPLYGGIALALGLLSFGVDLPPFLHLPGNDIGLLNAVATSAACLSFAYSYPGVAQRLLKGNDLSYGIYLFHMPLLNALLVNGVVGPTGAIITFVLTFLFAFVSWNFIESPALRSKKRLENYLSGRLWAGPRIREV